MYEDNRLGRKYGIDQLTLEKRSVISDALVQIGRLFLSMLMTVRGLLVVLAVGWYLLDLTEALLPAIGVVVAGICLLVATQMRSLTWNPRVVVALWLVLSVAAIVLS